MSNNLPTLSNEGGLSAYLEQIKKFPMLAAEEEYMLAKNWKTTGNIKAAEKLVTSHLRLVAKIAMGYKGYGLPINEMISEGNVGLMQAVKKFEPEKGFRLATYAMWWIKASIQEYILRSWSLVKIGTTTAQKKLFFNLKKIKNQISPETEGDLRDEHVNHIANKLDVSKEEVVSMNRRLSGKEFSLNAQVGEDGEYLIENGFVIPLGEDRLVDDYTTLDSLIEIQEADNFQRVVQEELDKLRLNERKAFDHRWLMLIPDLSQKELDALWEEELEEAKELAAGEECIEEILRETEQWLQELRGMMTPEEKEQEAA